MFELKVKLFDSDSRRRIAEERVKALKINVKAARLDAVKVVEEYKKSEDFKLEVAEGCVDSYHLRFFDCKKKVAMAFTDLDLWDIIESDEGEEDDSQGEKVDGARAPVEVGAGQACATAALGMVVEGNVEGIIVEAMVGAEAMVAVAVEGQDPAQQDVCGEE